MEAELVDSMTDPRLVVFSDVEGSLAGHHSSQGPAADIVAALARAAVPLVLSSTGTRAELEAIQADLGFTAPFVCEGGSAVVVPAGCGVGPAWARSGSGFELVFGRPYAEVANIVRDAARALRVDVIAFADLSAEEVAFDSNVPLPAARLAKMREFSEPFRLLDPSPAVRSRLLQALREAGLRCRGQARYLCATGAVDKGAAIAAVRTLYERRGERGVLTVGLGDDLDDVALLRQVDVPIIVQHDTAGAAARLLRKVPTAVMTHRFGPAGWAEAMDLIRFGGRLSRAA